MARIRKTLACVAIALNALWAGGIFTFPLLSPSLAEHTKLSQPQLTTIVLAGMMSQYTVASLVGKLIDVYGPAICSLLAGLLSSIAFGGFAAQIYFSPEDPSPSESASIFRSLTFCFLLAGLSTVLGYFSSLFAASKIFPRHIGISSGMSMAFFGLSPLFLSQIASSYFTDTTTSTLNVTLFTAFLGVSAAVVYTSTAFFLHLNRQTVDEQSVVSPSDTASADEERTVDETTSLLSTDAKPVSVQDSSVLSLLKQGNFWLLGLISLITLGSSEMIISNIGTIVVSLPPMSIEGSGNTATQLATSRQVKLLSASNTATRIAVGLLADFVSPAASSMPSGAQVFPRRHRITRVTFLSTSALILAWTFWWTSTRAATRDDVWILSVGTGVGYSAVFTVLPSIISSVWGINNLGRNFGILMYAPFLGNPIFSYIYAFVSDSHAVEGKICKGRICWEATFHIVIATCVVAFLVSLILRKEWKHML